jgi:hypothetical protein
MAESARRDEDALLANIFEHGHGSTAMLAQRMGWKTNKGEPQKWKAHTVLKRLREAKLVRLDRDRLVVTDLGKRAVNAKTHIANGGPNDDDRLEFWPPEFAASY